MPTISQRKKRLAIAAVVIAVYIALLFWSIPWSWVYALVVAAVYFFLIYKESKAKYEQSKI